MKPILVFQTDFTYKEGAICSMYGVVKTVDRELEIFDGTHEIPQYDIQSASYRLFQSMKFWPEGTIFVSVVDPGVGTYRRACVAKTADGYYVVTPDNGTLTHLKKWVGITEIREIDETKNRLRGKDTEGVSIFHGRDLFGYCAARLASGLISYEEVGTIYNTSEIIEFYIPEPLVKDNKVCGIFEINDPNFGNLWTNIPLSMFTAAAFNYGDYINVTIKYQGKEMYKDRVLFHKSFGFAEKGDVMIYNNELMRVGMAISQGNLCKKYNLNFGFEWTVEFEK